MMSFLDLIWIFLVFSALQPVVRQRWLEAQRLRLITRLERQRRSRVITLIHRRESMALLGFPISRFIDIEDSEAILRAIRMTPKEMPIDLIVHTPGGIVLATEQIARALIAHPGRVTVFIPHYAMSGGTLIALSADEIRMDENAVLGPVDPLLGRFPAASVLAVVDQKPIAEIDDETLMLADLSRKALRQVKSTVAGLLTGNGMDHERASRIALELTAGKWTHDYPITVDEARELGLPVQVGLPDEIYSLMSLYPQPAQRRPSVSYVPVPYRPSPSPPTELPRAEREARPGS